MRGLFGDFETMPLSDLVVYLGNKRAGGLLTLEREGTRKQVWVRRGMILNVSSNEPREYLGQFLINMGHITEEQFTRAYETQNETKVFLGKILVMIGAVSEEKLRSALSLKFRETLLDAFLWTCGTFRLEPSAELQEPDGLDLEIDLLDVHREGEFRQTAWEAIRAVFPSGGAKLEIVEENLPERPRPGSLDERLLALIKDRRSIDELVLALHATDFFLYQRLYALYRLDAIQVAKPEDLDLDEVLGAAPPRVAPLTSPADLPAEAEAKLAGGNYPEAEEIARRAHELLRSEGTAELLRRTEAELTTYLRRVLLEGGKVASMQVPADKLKTLQLTAPERYLISRVTGQRQVAAIVQVSPLRELEALKLLKRFIDAGLIKVS